MENFLWVTIGNQRFRTAQTKHIPKVFSILLKDFEQIIEIGTFTGAFTYWLSENKSDTCKIISYDNNQFVFNLLKKNKLPQRIDFLKGLERIIS